GTIGPKGPAEAERRVKLYHINRCWAEYLSYISYVRESIHLYNLGGKVPLDEFNIIAVKAFEDLLKNIDDSVVETLGTADIKAGGIDMEKEGLKSPSATWTYMVDDGAEQFGIMPALSNPIVAASSPIIYSIMALFKSYKNKNVKEIK
ncbi:MAG: accessory Sec system translocase SecA2, partial [Clostridiaceae bacterium]|nr:accessory Sec system translocase SecA2 [Clostridiaceae bacterium]